MSTPSTQAAAPNAAPASPAPQTVGIVGKAEAIEQSVVKTVRAKIAELVAEHYIKALLAGLSYVIGHLVGNSTIGNLIAKLF